MNDRELLERAARAAGYDVVWRCEHLIILHGDREKEKLTGFDGDYWRPLADDGDALRLAVQLRIDVCHNPAADNQRWVLAERAGCEGCFAPACCVEDDFDEPGRGAATRRAIVRAAAELCP